jgi:hypothetical protein
MAIKKAITLQSDIVVADAYHKVVATNTIRNGQDNRILIEVAIYKDEAAKCADKSPVMTFCLPQISGDDMQKFFSTDVLNAQGVNQIKQCYEYLKTQNIQGIDYTKDTMDV